MNGLRHAGVGQTATEAVAEIAAWREEPGNRPGGFGIAMSQAMADEILCNEVQNEVILITYLN